MFKFFGIIYKNKETSSPGNLNYSKGIGMKLPITLNSVSLKTSLITIFAAQPFFRVVWRLSLWRLGLGWSDLNKKKTFIIYIQQNIIICFFCKLYNQSNKNEIIRLYKVYISCKRWTDKTSKCMISFLFYFIFIHIWNVYNNWLNFIRIYKGKKEDFIIHFKAITYY